MIHNLVIQQIVSAAYKTASQNHNFKRTFPEKPLVAFRRPKNIGQYVTKAELYPLPRDGMRIREPPPGFYKCQRFGGQGCAMCPFVESATSHYASATGKNYPIKSRIICTTENVIYDLWCKKCKNDPSAIPGSDQYVGKTGDTASQRFSSHKSDVNNFRTSKAIGEHFNLPEHKPSDMRFLPFEKVFGDDPTVLSSREEYWILEKKTLEFGINRRK